MIANELNNILDFLLAGANFGSSVDPRHDGVYLSFEKPLVKFFTVRQGVFSSVVSTVRCEIAKPSLMFLPTNDLLNIIPALKWCLNNDQQKSAIKIRKSFQPYESGRPAILFEISDWFSAYQGFAVSPNLAQRIISDVHPIVSDDLAVLPFLHSFAMLADNKAKVSNDAVGINQVSFKLDRALYGVKNVTRNVFYKA